MTDRWTAPQTGWYRIPTGSEPEYLGTERPDTETDDTPPVYLLRSLTDLDDQSPFAEGPAQVTVTVIHFEQSAIAINAATLPPATETSITIPWNG